MPGRRLPVDRLEEIKAPVTGDMAPDPGTPDDHGPELSPETRQLGRERQRLDERRDHPDERAAARGRRPAPAPAA